MKRITPWFVLSCLSSSLLVWGQIPPQTVSTNEFLFRLPRPAAFRLEGGELLRQSSAPAGAQWLRAQPDGSSTNRVEFGSRVVVQLKAGAELKRLIDGRPLELARAVEADLFILQAPDAITAAREAQRLATLPEVSAAYPVLRREGLLHGPYAPRSNDPFFVPYFNVNPSYEALWPLEDRGYDGARLGCDVNVLAAWPFSSGAGITVAVADTGVEWDHYELAPRMAGAPHFNFAEQSTNASPNGGHDTSASQSLWTHGTQVAGLIAAEANNGLGMAGVAPQSKIASWVIFDTNGLTPPDDQLMEMYQYAPDTIAIQNHSWSGGNGVVQQVGPTLLELVGIDHAVTLGRNGLGTVMVRSAGNDRGTFEEFGLLARADDDAYMSDPRVIPVGAVTRSGRVTSYSEPGACLLLAAPGGGGDSSQGLFTLDLLGSRGIVQFFPGLNDFCWGPYGFIGTSAAAPLVSGVAALVLSANTNLSYRDVQQILLLSARQWDLADPDLATNGAGLPVSHNVGFGIPDAGLAVRLARSWTHRPSLATVSVIDSQPLPIPDDSLRVEVTGPGVPAALTSVRCLPSTGLHADQPTASLPLVDAGLATNVPALNLTNKGALIMRGTNTFFQKVANAAAAGAAFAVIYSEPGDDSLVFMAGMDFAPIPAVFIAHTNGEALRALVQTNASVTARIHLQSVDRVLHVNSTLLCEHVGVRILTDHARRGDVRITLRSPQGTRSVLQRFNQDASPGPVDWTYWSTHHFFESSAGDWTVSVSDESASMTGAVRSVSLIVRGTEILDTDRDGLDDNWEQQYFGSLAFGPGDDPDGDGFVSSREQVMGRNPAAADEPFRLSASAWVLAGYQRTLLNWPSATRYYYEIHGGTNPAALTWITNVPGAFAETEWMGPYSLAPGGQYFRARAVPNP